MNQLMAAKYHLLALGCKINNEEKSKLGIEAKRLENSAHTQGINIYDKKLYMDHFYREFGKMEGLKSSSNIWFPDKVMNSMVMCMISLLNSKMVISQDILLLCWVYCLETQNKKLAKQFVDALRDVSKECLEQKQNLLETGSKNNNSSSKGKRKSKKKKLNNDDDIRLYFKERNYQWFKMFLLHSNIWLANSFGSKHGILFDAALEVVNEQLIVQKQYIWDNVQTEEKTNQESFAKLVQFGNEHQKNSDDIKVDNNSRSIKVNNNNNNNVLRQDKIVDGILPVNTELELLLMACKMDEEKSEDSIGAFDFDIAFENNTKTYLTKCLSFAHVHNSRFQNEMKRIFDSNSDKYPNCKYQSAPVKGYQRCLTKCTEYSNYSWPTSACILDFLRFSVTFDSIEALLKGINMFIFDINNDLIKCLKPYGIVRIKNGFLNIDSKWKDCKDAHYCDIKLNIIYRDPYNETNEKMIVEAQFLLSFLLKAKKLGHKIYSIARQSDYIYNITNQVYKIDNNYKNYKFKINKLIENNDIINITKQLFWRPNILLSIINTDGNYCFPLLYTIGQKFSSKSSKQYNNNNNKGNDKFVLLFLNCLFHYSLILLNEPNDKKNEFLKEYFNFNFCGYPLIYNNHFFGIDTSSIGNGNNNNNNNTNNNIKYNIIETIMKQDYFNGLSQIETNKGNILYYCINENCYEYLSLISDYFEKNLDVIKDGINHYGSFQHPLLLLLQNKKINKQAITSLGVAGAMIAGVSDGDGMIGRTDTLDAIRAVEAAEKMSLQDKRGDFLRLYLELSEKSQEFIQKSTLQEAIGLCKYILNGDVYSTMIQDYMIKCKINDKNSK